jgi:hypothetical protein
MRIVITGAAGRIGRQMRDRRARQPTSAPIIENGHRTECGAVFIWLIGCWPRVHRRGRCGYYTAAMQSAAAVTRKLHRLWSAATIGLRPASSKRLNYEYNLSLVYNNTKI